MRHIVSAVSRYTQGSGGLYCIAPCEAQWSEILGLQLMFLYYAEEPYPLDSRRCVLKMSKLVHIRTSSQDRITRSLLYIILFRIISMLNCN